MKNILIPTLFILLINNSSAQSKKDIRKYNIKVEIETIQEGNATYKSEQTIYDNNGNEIEWIKYNKDGSIKRKRIFKYDKKNNLIEEQEYEGTQLVKKIVYTYNNFDEKTSVITYDNNNQILKKEIYTYNNKGLKAEKKVYDKNDKLIATHTYQYYSGKNKSESKNE